jgi:hypothetical protein
MDMKQMKQDLKGLIARGHGSSLKARELRTAIKAAELISFFEAQAKAHPGEKK